MLRMLRSFNLHLSEPAASSRDHHVGRSFVKSHGREFNPSHAEQLYYCPVPVSATATLVAGAETFTFKLAVLLPVLVGLKVTVTVQFAPTESLAGQVLPAMLNWLAFAPPIRIELMVSCAVPGLLITTVCGALVVFLFWVPKARDVGDTEFIGATPVPDAVNDTVPIELAMLTGPLSTPVVVGAKRTVIRQLRPGNKFPTQFVLSEKLEGQETPLIVTAVAPTFETVTV